MYKIVHRLVSTVEPPLRLVSTVEPPLSTVEFPLMDPPDLATYLHWLDLERTSESRRPLYNGQKLCFQLVYCREVPLYMLEEHTKIKQLGLCVFIVAKLS